VSTIAILGGSGDEGRALALRFALAGESVVLGSRSAERAEHAAATVRQRLGADAIRIAGGTNREAAGAADLVCVCLPVAGLEGELPGLRAETRGKIVLDVVNPVGRVASGFEAMALPAPSAGEWIAALLPEARVVSALKTLSADHLADVAQPLRGDALVCGDEPAAKRRIFDLARRIPGVRPVDCGPLRNARYVEAATVLLLELNRLHRVTTGLRVVGLGGDARGGVAQTTGPR
jgi:NADPH-dependent F420 reductase